MKSRYEEMRDQCRAFHAAHPEVWKLFVNFTFERQKMGFKNYSVNAIFERIRWETDQADVDGKSTFKLNNNYRPFYARRFMKIYARHDGFFRLRKQISKGKPANGMDELGPPDFN